jgi:hypothetical protein
MITYIVGSRTLEPMRTGNKSAHLVPAYFSSYRFLGFSAKAAHQIHDECNDEEESNDAAANHAATKIKSTAAEQE